MHIYTTVVATRPSWDEQLPRQQYIQHRCKYDVWSQVNHSEGKEVRPPSPHIAQGEMTLHEYHIYIYIDKKNKPDRVCDCHGSTNDIMLAVYWRNESGSPWRSIDWLWEQYNRVGSVWQKAKWGRHVEPHSIEPNISYHNRKWQRHFQRGKKNCNMRRALVQLLHVIWKLNNFIWQSSLPCGHRATEAAGINPVLLARFSRMK